MRLLALAFAAVVGWVYWRLYNRPGPTEWHPYGEDWDRLSREMPPRRRRRWEAKW